MKAIIRQFFILVNSLLLSACAFAITASLDIDKESVVLGEPFVITISVHTDAFTCKDIAFPEKERFLPLLVKNEDCKRKGGVIVKSYELFAFQLGDIPIKGLKIKAGPDEIPLKDITIHVKELLPKDVKGVSPKPNADFVKQAFPWPIVLLLLLLLSAAAVWFYYKRRFDLDDDGHFYSKRPYWEIVKERIIDLEKKKLPEHQLWKQFYYELTEMLRFFLQNRFQVKALEMTAYELEPAIRRLNIEDSEKNGIIEVLFNSQPVKYAGAFMDSKATAEKDLLFVKSFIDKYSPKPDQEDQ